jgi:MFS family permease
VVNNPHLSIHVIGIFFFAHTMTIVLAQLVVVNTINQRSRTRVLALVAVLWFIFWVILAVSLALSALLAALSLTVAMVVFALGETILSPLGPAIVNEIAPEHLRGRYNTAQGLT